MRRVLPFAILAGCLAIGVLPAFAADRTVAIRDSFYSPREVGVMPGEHGDVGRPGQPHAQRPLRRARSIRSRRRARTSAGRAQFDDAGVFRYRCDVHGFMRGTVHVNATGTVPTPDPTASPTPSPTASATPPARAASGRSPAPGPAAPAVTSFRARATKTRFCTRRSARCKRPGVFLALDLEARESVRVRGTLRRGSRRVRTFTLTGRPGRQRVRLPGPALKAGRYALTLRAGELSRVVRFRVRASRRFHNCRGG